MGGERGGHEIGEEEEKMKKENASRYSVDIILLPFLLAHFSLALAFDRLP